MIKAKINIAKKRERIERLKVFQKRMQMGFMKKDAIRMIDNFKEGIKNQSLGLKKLLDFSINDKMRMGLDKPDVPLYGMGENIKNSLINSLRIEPIEKGFRVFASDKLHHEETNESMTLANLPMSALLSIHEHGCTIPVTPRQRRFLAIVKGLHLKLTTKFIVIPPRPAFKKAGQKTKREIKHDKPMRAHQMSRAIVRYVNTGQTILMNTIMGYIQSGKEYDES